MAKSKTPVLHEAHDHVKSLHALVDELRDLKMRLYQHISHVGDDLKEGKYDVQDLCDVGFLCREAEILFDDGRKDAKARKEAASSKLCKDMLQASLTDLSTEPTVVGSLASGHIDLKMETAPPSPGEPGYNEFMDWLGVSQETRKSGLVKSSWTEVNKILQRAMEDGKPIPPGLPKPWPVYQTRYYARKAGK